jgi:ribose 5-phosphate isomerase B
MARRALITEETILQAVRSGQTRLVLSPEALVTPLAQDTARAKGVALVPAAPDSGAAPEAPASSPAPQVVALVVALGSDHGGFAYKQTLAADLPAMGWTVLDVGSYREEPCDYPDFAYAVAHAVRSGKAAFGVMIDGAGLGSAMVCNKVPGIRAACAYNEFTAWNARAHNHANVLTLGSRSLGIEVCKRVLRVFLETPFEGGRHEGRLRKLADVEARFLLK